MGLQPPMLWGTSCHTRPAMSASLLLWPCQSSVSRASSPCLSCETIPECCPNRHLGAGPALTASLQLALPPEVSQATQPPSLMGAEEQDTPAAPSNLLSTWQWYTYPPLRAPHIWGMEGTQESWLPGPAPSPSCVSTTAGSPQSHCVNPENWPHLKHTGTPNLSHIPKHHWLHHSSSCPLGILAQQQAGREAGRLQPTDS